MALQQKLIPGSLVVRQSGGTPGVDEVQIYHDGTNAIVAPASGSLTIDSAIVVTGSTTLETSLNGILKTSSGLVTGSASLGDLADVVINSPSVNDIITFNGTSFVNQPVFSEKNITVDTFSGDGSTTVFTLSSDATTSASLDITAGGICIPPSDYTVDGDTLTFNSALPISTIQVKHLASASIVVDYFTGDGSTTVFSLSYPAESRYAVDVISGGFFLSPSDYTLNGTDLTFSSAPPAGPISVKNLLGINYTTVDEYTGDGSTTVYTLSIPAFTAESLSVIIGDVYIPTTDYTINGTTFTFSSAPPSAAPIQIKHLSDFFVLGTGSVALSNLAVGTPGNLISYDSNGTAVAVATGTAGQILTSNGAGLAPTMQNSNIGWVIKESGDFLDLSSLNFTGLTKTTKFILTDVSSSLSTDVRLLTSSDDGSSYDASSNDYQYSITDLGDGDLDQSTTDPFIPCCGSAMITTAGYVSKFEITVYAPNSSNVTILDINSLVFATGPELQGWTGNGARMNAGIVNALQFYPGAGGTISGTYTVLELN